MNDTIKRGDTVRVKIRSEPGSDRVVHKFEGEIININDLTMSGSKTVHIRLPFGTVNSISISEHKAEFEVIQ